MSRLLDDENDLLLQRDRELTLSTGAILAIFLGLVLLCAVFFGFGYNLGRKSGVTGPSAATAAPGESAQPAAPSSNTFDDFKPPPSSPATAPATSAPAVTLPAVSTAATATPGAASTAAPTPTAAVTHSATSAPHPPPAFAKTPAPATVPLHSAAAASPSVPAVAPKGAFVVQVAAVSRKDDADLLVGALHAKGYQVAERSEPQDKLIHIQVGPFGTRTDAEAMREKLVLDGYNAIVK